MKDNDGHKLDYSRIHANDGYVWPNEGVKIIDSEKTNVTVWFGSLGEESKVRTTLEYWTR